LAKLAAFSTTADAVAFRPKLTYFNGVINAMPKGFERGEDLVRKTSDGYDAPFPEVLATLGDYVPWDKVLEKAKGSRCVRFHRAFTTGSSWMWLNNPIPSYYNIPLAELIHLTLSRMEQATPRTSRCGYVALWVTRRSAHSRRVVNEDEVVRTLRGTLPTWDVREIDLSKLSFKEQIKTVREADVFIFPHGGAGPHVMWLPHGAVVIELFPYGDADPMYRNLAVQTGKTYLSWQAEKYLRPLNETIVLPDDYHFTNLSNFRVDIDALKPLLKSASLVVRNSIGTNWLTSLEGRPYVKKLCTLCTIGGEHSYGCDDKRTPPTGQTNAHRSGS
jgi:Glycosyltransferase 61